MSLKVRMQADDFFNTYRVLSESNELALENPAKLKGRPLETTKAMGVLPAMGVTVVCLSFSLELYIKDIYYRLGM